MPNLKLSISNMISEGERERRGRRVTHTLEVGFRKDMAGVACILVTTAEAAVAIAVVKSLPSGGVYTTACGSGGGGKGNAGV